jgi:hypothetical protein
MPCAIAAQTSQAPLSYWLAGQPVLVLSNGQFEMTAHVVAAVLNRVYACTPYISIMSQLPHFVGNIFGGSRQPGQVALIVAYTKNRSIGARLIRACL